MAKNDLILSNVNTYIKGFLVDSEDDVADMVDVEISLPEMKRLTHSDTVEVVLRYIGKRRFAFIHGVKSSGKASALDASNNIMMINSIIVAGVRQYPSGFELRSLTEDEVGHIKDNLGLMYIHEDNGRGGKNAYCIKNVGTRPQHSEGSGDENESR